MIKAEKGRVHVVGSKLILMQECACVLKTMRDILIREDGLKKADDMIDAIVYLAKATEEEIARETEKMKRECFDHLWDAIVKEIKGRS